MWTGIIAGGPSSLEVLQWPLSKTLMMSPESMVDSAGTTCVAVRIIYDGGFPSVVFRHHSATEAQVEEAMAFVDEMVAGLKRL